MILCPHEKIISKSEADFDTQWRRRTPRDLEGSVATLLPLPNRFVSTEGWRRHDFIIVAEITLVGKSYLAHPKLKLAPKATEVFCWLAVVENEDENHSIAHAVAPSFQERL